jgi:integrase
VILGLAAGLRLAEVVALQWSDVDFATGNVSIVRSSWGTTKNGKKRSLTLPDSQVARLRRIKIEQAKNLLLLGVRQTELTTVCAKSDGTPMAHQTLRGVGAVREGHRAGDLISRPPALEHDRTPSLRCRREDGCGAARSQPGATPADLPLRAVGGP